MKWLVILDKGRTTHNLLVEADRYERNHVDVAFYKDNNQVASYLAHDVVGVSKEGVAEIVTFDNKLAP